MKISKKIILAAGLSVMPTKPSLKIHAERTRTDYVTNFANKISSQLKPSVYVNINRIWESIPKIAKPHVNMDVTKNLYNGSTEFLNKFLNGGVLAGKGKAFYNAQQKYGIDAVFLIGIAKHESGNGTSKYARQYNNVAGMMGKNGPLRFSSVDACIDKMAANLKEKYINKGRKTINKIGEKYAESRVWPNRVVQHMNGIYRTSLKAN